MSGLCVVSISDRPAFSSRIHAVLERYCKRWGYPLRLFHETLDDGRHISWSKIRAIQALLNEGYDTVVWIDDDIVVTNPDKPLTDFLALMPETSSFLVSADADPNTPLNAGMMFVRNCPTARETLRVIWDLCDSVGTRWRPNWEQDVFIRYRHLHPELFTIVPHRTFQSFLRNYGTPPGLAWQPGDFAAHITGMPLPDRVEYLNQLLALLAKTNSYTSTSTSNVIE